MRSGFLAALRATAQTGQPPVPEPRATQGEPMGDLHEQLLASLTDTPTTSPISVRTVPIVTPTGAMTAPMSVPPGPPPPRSVQTVGLAGQRDRVGRAGRGTRGGPGTIEEALGLEPDVVPEAPAQDARGGEDDDRVEQALAAEAAGVQTLPLEPEIAPAESPTVDETTFAVSMLEEAIDSSENPQPVPLTYDLPTDPDLLPPFCFICGQAGTGKTFWAKALAQCDHGGVVLAATTGIAAVNLGEGTTINALLRYYDTASLTDAFTGGWLEAQLKRHRGAGLRRIVLDETSMLDGDQLTILSRAIDNVNQDRTGDDAELGLILVGDFAQLAPVKAPYAFESPEWGRYAAATYPLTTIWRQADRPFVEALQAVRRGDATAALDFFGPRLEQTTLAHYRGTTILAKNEAVDKFNQLRLDKVLGTPVTFSSSRWGKLRGEWGGPPKPPREWGIPETLSLKIGATVMILANRNIAEKGDFPEYLYVNGYQGDLVDVQRGEALVTLRSTGETVTVVPITRDNVIPLEPGRRKALREAGTPERISVDGKHEIIGGITYMPMRLSWATTCHKSQGLSLDEVQVNIRDHFFRTPSMLYVALSRARTAEGLRIVGTPEGFRARCTVSEKVKPWL